MKSILIPLFCFFGAIPVAFEKPIKKEIVQEESKLTLYVSDNCYYCKKVLSYMKAEGINLQIKRVGEGDNKEILIQKGKKGQVPCLFIGDKPLYESDDIIQYLKAHK
jgi:glutaredoxin 3